jgi:hypothetical protein
MSILGRISGSLPFRGQRGGAPAPAPASDKPKPPPPPIQRPAGKPASTPASDKKGPPPGPPPIQRPASKPAGAPASDKKGPPPGPPPIQRPASKQATPSGDKPKPPPGPPARTKPTGGPPPISIKSQADKDKEAIQSKITSARMTGDQLRMAGGHRSADSHYRKADEMESRLKQGAPQLDDEAMSKIRPSDHLRDNPGSGWGRY